MTPIENKIIRLVSIPIFINTKLSLEEPSEGKSSIPCPLHNEQKGKSFVFSVAKRKWRCYGKCQRGGDVIDLYQLLYKFSTREDAIPAILKDFDISADIKGYSDITSESKLSDLEKRYRVLYNSLLRAANTPERWIDLDYVMSFHIPLEELILKLEVLKAKWI